jgi:hypothetical protein
MAKKDVVRLLVRLYGDPKLAERLGKDAEKVMKAARLSAQERALLASGDAAAIQAYLGRESVKANIKTKFLAANIKTKTALANIKTTFRKK